jgi:hypothetical protein
MTREILAVGLAAMLSGGCFAQAQPSKLLTPNEQAHAIVANHPVEVQFLNGSHQRGLIDEVSDTGFVLSQDKKKQIEKLQVAFDQVKSVKPVNNVKPSHTTRNVLIVVGIGFFIFVEWVGAHT